MPPSPLPNTTACFFEMLPDLLYHNLAHHFTRSRPPGAPGSSIGIFPKCSSWSSMVLLYTVFGQPRGGGTHVARVAVGPAFNPDTKPLHTPPRHQHLPTPSLPCQHRHKMSLSSPSPSNPYHWVTCLHWPRLCCQILLCHRTHADNNTAHAMHTQPAPRLIHHQTHPRTLPTPLITTSSPFRQSSSPRFYLGHRGWRACIRPLCR